MSASVAAADAFVIVTPEYNYGPPPSLINAFDYVYKEWNYKAAGFVSYGGVSGGLRAVQMEKQTLDSGAKRNAVKRSGFGRPFQARQARLGMAS